MRGKSNMLVASIIQKGKLIAEVFERNDIRKELLREEHIVSGKIHALVAKRKHLPRKGENHVIGLEEVAFKATVKVYAPLLAKPHPEKL